MRSPLFLTFTSLSISFIYVIFLYIFIKEKSVLTKTIVEIVVGDLYDVLFWLRFTAKFSEKIKS